MASPHRQQIPNEGSGGQQGVRYTHELWATQQTQKRNLWTGQDCQTLPPAVRSVPTYFRLETRPLI